MSVPYSTSYLRGLLEYGSPTETQKKAIEAVLEHGNQRDAGIALGCGQTAVSNHIRYVKRKAARAGFAPDHGWVSPQPEGFHVKGVSTLTRDTEGNPQWVKADADRQQQERIAREAVEAIAADVPRIEPRRAPDNTYEKLLSLYPLGDPHFGMYAWASECGADFDLEIAEHDLCAALDYLVDRSPPSRRGVLLNLGDMFHAENMEGITTKHGNVLDIDTRFPMMVDVGVRALRRCIERMLDNHETVEMVNVPGNHDEVLAFTLSTMFANVYENEPRVVVHREPTQRHYIEHGRCLIGATHGHRTKDRDLPGLMATEQPEAWGRTRHRYYFRGHDHQDFRQEFNGCVVEHVRTLAPGDAFDVGNGYLSGQDMKCLVLHADHGEQTRFTCGIDVLRA